MQVGRHSVYEEGVTHGINDSQAEEIREEGNKEKAEAKNAGIQSTLVF